MVTTGFLMYLGVIEATVRDVAACNMSWVVLGEGCMIRAYCSRPSASGLGLC